MANQTEKNYTRTKFMARAWKPSSMLHAAV